jgi:hypothetical protein
VKKRTYSKSISDECEAEREMEGVSKDDALTTQPEKDKNKKPGHIQ